MEEREEALWGIVLKKVAVLLILVSDLLINAAHGEVQIIDYGARGHSFGIKEQSLLEVIMSKLQKAEVEGRLEDLQANFRQKALRSISKPKSVAGLKKAESYRSWTYDPTLTQIEPILDGAGKVIVAAGTIINPLDYTSWGEPLI